MLAYARNEDFLLRVAPRYTDFLFGVRSASPEELRQFLNKLSVASKKHPTALWVKHHCVAMFLVTMKGAGLIDGYERHYFVGPNAISKGFKALLQAWEELLVQCLSWIWGCCIIEVTSHARLTSS